MTERIAYAVSRFPLVTETFILREMQELERRGWSVDLYSIIHEHPKLIHPEAREFDERGHYLRTVHPDVLLANAGTLRSRPRAYAHALTRTVLGNLRSPGFLARAVAIFPGAVELARRMRSRGVRHIHAHFGTHAALLAMIAAELNDIGFSFTVHAVDLYVDTTMLAEKVRAARFVATISDFNRRLLGDLAGPSAASKIHVVRCGVDVDTHRAIARAGLGAPMRILAVGSLRDYKGHSVLIDACAMLQRSYPHLQFTCEIVGEGPERPRLERQIDALGLGGRVHLLGARDQHEVLRCMRESDVLVMPSVIAPNGLMEGIPVTLMESLAVGLPSIATRISGIPELVIDGETGLLVPPSDAAALVEAMATTAADYDAALARAQRGRALVEHEYSLERNVGRLEFLFENVLSGAAQAKVLSHAS